jgi:predicted permease
MFRRRKQSDFDSEIAAHIEAETARLVADGMSADQARDTARRSFGNVTAVRERFYEARPTLWLEQFVQDIRHGLRNLRRAPAFTLVAVASLALGIGANTACFSLLDGLLLKRLPVRDPEELRILRWEQVPKAPLKSSSGYGMKDERTGRNVRGSFSYPAYRAFVKQVPQFSELVAFQRTQFALRISNSSDFAEGQYVSGNYFSALGAGVRMGRPLLPEDDRIGAHRVGVISYRSWERRFGRDPNVLGQQVHFNNEPLTIVGVADAAFQGLYPGPPIDVFVPISMAFDGPGLVNRSQPESWWVQIFGRLKPGVSEEAATAALQAIFAHTIEEYAGMFPDGYRIPPVVLADGGRGVGLLRVYYSKSLLILTAVTVIVLLIACANLANLLIARGAAREREFAVRLSLGAGRGRVMRQVLAEGLLLAGAGAAAGVLLSSQLRQLILTLVAGSQPIALDARTDSRVLGFTVVVTLATALLSGLGPALRASRIDLTPSLRQSAPGGRTRGAARASRLLIPAQVALSLLLLVGAGLFIRTLLKLYSVDLGFDADQVLTFQTNAAGSAYQGGRAGEVYGRIRDRLNAIPAVTSADFAQEALITGSTSDDRIYVGDPSIDSAGSRSLQLLYCSETFLETMRITLRQGRGLRATDGAGAPLVAVVNESFVRRFVPNGESLGIVFYRGEPEKHSAAVRPIQVVGVVKNAHYAKVRGEVPPAAYFSYRQWPENFRGVTFVLRTRTAPLSIAPDVRRAVAGIDASLPVAQVTTQKDQISASLGTERMFAMLVSWFGGLAALLAAIGLYGVTAYAVSRRTAEIGIRIALGAARRDVHWLVVRSALLLVGAGIAAGVPLAFWLVRLVEKLLYGVEPVDPLSFAVAILGIISIGALSAWLPARRAARIDPNIALRAD